MKTKATKITGIISIIAAVALIVTGIFTWTLITSQLKEEHITVSADSPMLPGKPVAGPFTAYAQAQIIKHHALTNKDVPELDGKTYSELGTIATQAKEDGNTELADAATAMRTTAMNGSFLRASLFTSVLSYGVSAFAMGIGVVLAFFGWALLSLGVRPSKKDGAESGCGCQKAE